MQLDGEVDLEAGRAAAPAPSPRKRVSSGTRKVTIRLSENIHSQLEAATERPGVGKSMVVEAALAQFMNPQPSVENAAQKSSEAIHARFDFSGARFADNRRDGRAARAISPRSDATSASTATA